MSDATKKTGEEATGEKAKQVGGSAGGGSKSDPAKPHVPGGSKKA